MAGSRHTGFLVAKSTYDDVPDPVVGDLEGPYLSDVAGVSVLAVNPTMVFYGIEVEGQEAQLIAGKEAAFALFFKDAAKSVKEEVSIGADNTEFSFIKFSLDSPGGVLSAEANAVKLFCMTLDLFSYCPVSNETIAITLEADKSTLDIAHYWADDILITDVQEVFGLIVGLFTGSNKDSVLRAITKVLYKNPDEAAEAVKFFNTAQKLMTVFGEFNKVYHAGQKVYPFFRDLAVSDIRRSWCITQSDGVLSSVVSCSYLPPIPRFTFSPESVLLEGDLVEFDASSSSDPNYDLAFLEFSWDFDGDGALDTNWSSVATATYS